MGRVRLLLVVGALWVSGCGDVSSSASDLSALPRDLSGGADMTVADLSPPRDLTPVPDLTRPPDLVTPTDLTPEPTDLAVALDLAEPPDLAPPDDLTVPPDLVVPPDFRKLPDLIPPPDLVVLPDLVPGPDLAGPQTIDVTVGPNGNVIFDPANITIKAGDTVRWTWGSNFHSVTSGSNGVADGKFCSPNDANCAQGTTSNAGFVYTHLFPAAGVFPYYCAPHRLAGMTGTVTVQ